MSDLNVRPGLFASGREALRVLGLAVVMTAPGWIAIVGAWLWIARHP